MERRKFIKLTGLASLVSVKSLGICTITVIFLILAGYIHNGNTGHKAMALYNVPNIKFHTDIVYTNTPPSGAYRGYGVPQGFWALEPHMERIARALDLDPLEFRLKNAIKEGDEHPERSEQGERRPRRTSHEAVSSVKQRREGFAHLPSLGVEEENQER